MSDSVFYFAYGSNMDPARFQARVGSWISRRHARLHDYRLRFASMVQSEGGGGAVVDPFPGHHVDGVLFEIAEAQLTAMDREEFDPSRDRETSAERIRRTVETPDGPIEAELYTVEDDGGFLAPSETYLNLILDGLHAAGCPADAIANVRAAAETAARSGTDGPESVA